jgi:glutamate-1-semialdehyde 2,1-aminomutase
MTARLRAGTNGVIVDRGVPGFVYGEASVFHIVLGHRCDNLMAGDLHTPTGVTPEVLKAGSGQKVEGILTAGMLLGGAHLFHAGGLLSMKHTPEDVDKTVEAFDHTVTRMRDEGLFNG